jgi:hypothetical protein
MRQHRRRSRENTMAKMTPRKTLGARPRYVREVPVTEGSADTDSGIVSGDVGVGENDSLGGP